MADEGLPVFLEHPWSYGFGAPGDIWIQWTDGYWESVEIPGDFTSQTYVLTGNPITGKPYWAAATITLVEAFGYGTGYGLGYGRD
jgi:hypothetical protein